jgi:glycosyltransferase involved in cell wall biosynthesis
MSFWRSSNWFPSWVASVRGDGVVELPVNKGVLPGPLAVCGFFKNEALYLREWIEFYRLLGVERFYLYNNGSTDQYLEVLRPYVEKGIVWLHRWRTPFGHVKGFNHCLQHYGESHRWIAFVDIDEFLFPSVGDSLLTLLSEYESFGGLAVHWVVFSTSGHILRPTGPVVLEYTRSQGEGNRHVKLVVRPECVEQFTGTHTAKFKPGWFAVNENKEKVSGPYSPPTIDRVRINHYWTRSVEDFILRKVPNGISDSKAKRTVDQLFRAERKYSSVKDTVIQRFLPRLVDRLSN